MELTEGVGESSSPPRTFGGFSYYEMKNDIYNRLVENGNEEVVCNPGFRELLDAHFNRLPHRYDCFFIDLCWVFILCFWGYVGSRSGDGFEFVLIALMGEIYGRGELSIFNVLELIG